MLVDEVESKQGMAQVVEDAHEHDEVEFLADCTDIVDGHLGEIDLQPDHAGGEAGLGEVVLVEVDAEHAGGTASLHLQ
jgi:hypothetical protein